MGYDFRALSGTGQSDFFLTYVGCPTKEQIPPQAGLRLNTDLIEFCSEHMPHWIPVSIAGYNGADSGLNGPQELGAVMANAIEYLDEVKRRDMDVTQVARGVGGINLRTSMAFVEDVAKPRAARKMWHHLLHHPVRRDRSEGPTASHPRRDGGLGDDVPAATEQHRSGNPHGTRRCTRWCPIARCLRLRRGDMIPSDHAHQMSIRTQQILQEEFEGLIDVADPVGVPTSSKR